MRLDKWLKVSRLIKRRTVANEACDNERISANGRVVKASYDVKEGDTILLDDGLVRLTVLETDISSIRCRVENDGIMKDNKGVNIPNVRLSLPYMNQRDREDMEKAGAGRGIRQFGGQKTMYCG